MSGKSGASAPRSSVEKKRALAPANRIYFKPCNFDDAICAAWLAGFSF